MQKDDLPNPLVPLMMHVNGALNLRSLTSVVCTPTNLSLRSKRWGFEHVSFVAEGDERLVSQTPVLEERDPGHLVLRLGNYQYYTFPSTFPLPYNLVLTVHSYGSLLHSPQNHVSDNVKIDDAVRRYNLTLFP